jgi:putative flippase GtrA
VGAVRVDDERGSMRILKFGSVGLLNTAVDFVVFNLLVLALGMPIALANVLSYSVGIANSWFWNSRWTFADRPTRSARLALPTFVGVNLVGLVLNTVVLLALRAAGERIGIPALVAEAVYLNVYKTIAIIASFTWNYLATRRIVFG